MAIVIRHGSNGAMKTATAVDAYMIPAAKDGRTIVTNIRGFTRERCFKEIPDLYEIIIKNNGDPEAFDVISIDDQSKEGKRLMATWFHWVPNGALLVFDEASSQFPKSWREKDIRALDYPGGLEAAASADRPDEWFVAWEKHRHWNWDIVLTTPNIRGIRDDIRGTTEMAYRHRGLGKFLTDKCRKIKQVQHDAQKNGFTHADAIIVNTYTASKLAFRLYDSTQTGVTRGSNAGQSIFTGPKVLILCFCLALAFGILIFTGGPKIVPEANAAPAVAEFDSVVAEVSISPGVPKTVRVPVSSMVPKFGSQDDSVTDPLSDHRLRILGNFDGVTQILVTSSNNDETIMTPMILSKIGYAFFPITDCVGRLVYQGMSRLVMCGKAEEKVDKTPGVSFGAV
jgi:zona occludens toxin